MTFPCFPSAGFYTARVLMLLRPLSLPSLTTDGSLLKMVNSCEPSLRETTKRWMDLDLSVDREGAVWVTEPKGAIKKANLTFTAKFLWLIDHHCLYPTAVDNIVTWDRAVLMAALIDGLEVDFAWFL